MSLRQWNLRVLREDVRMRNDLVCNRKWGQVLYPETGKSHQSGFPVFEWKPVFTKDIVKNQFCWQPGNSTYAHMRDS